MISHLLSTLDHYLQVHPYMGLLFAFVIAFAESLPILGSVIPGSVTMSVIGVFVGRGMVPLSATLLFATLGAILADTLGFWIGKRYDKQLKNMWLFKKYPHWLIKGEAFFNAHGGKSILIGRFVGPMRSMVPLVAGFLKMNWARFLFAAIFSSFLWAIAYLLPGILIGALSLALPPTTAIEFLVVGLIIVVFLWFLFWLIQRFFTFLALSINNRIDRFWNWLYHHHSAKFLTWITNRKQPTDHHQLLMLTLAVVSFIIFLIFLIIAVTLGPSTNLNGPPFYLLQSIRTPKLDEFFVAVTLLGQGKTILGITILFALILAIKKQWRSACYLIGIFLISTVAVYFFKSIIHSPRPTGFLSIIKTSSFPSGHTCLSVTVLGFIAFLTAREMKRGLQFIPYLINSLLVLLIAFSRLYLGAHWLEDVLAGLFLGFTILLIMIVFYRRYLPDPWTDSRLLIIMGVVLILPWIAVNVLKFKQTLYYSSPSWTIQYTTFEDWWNNPTQYIPIYRLNRFGHPDRPLNIQWAENLSHLQQRLTQQGWVDVHSQTDLKKTLGRFIGHLPEQRQPLLPELYQQKPPVLFLIKHLPNKEAILELRLWNSNVKFTNTATPLWIGSINYHAPKINLFSLRKSQEIKFNEKDDIAQALLTILNHCTWKIVQTTVSDQPEKIRELKWDGSILITSCEDKQK